MRFQVCFIACFFDSFLDLILMTSRTAASVAVHYHGDGQSTQLGQVCVCDREENILSRIPISLIADTSTWLTIRSWMSSVVVPSSISTSSTIRLSGNIPCRRNRRGCRVAICLCLFLVIHDTDCIVSSGRYASLQSNSQPLSWPMSFSYIRTQGGLTLWVFDRS